MSLTPPEEIPERVDELDESSKQYVSLRDNYAEALKLLRGYLEVDGARSVARSSFILDKLEANDKMEGSEALEDRYTESQLGYRLYPLRDIGILETWGGGSPLKWDISNLNQDYLEDVEEELSDIFEVEEEK